MNNDKMNPEVVGDENWAIWFSPNTKDDASWHLLMTGDHDDVYPVWEPMSMQMEAGKTVLLVPPNETPGFVYANIDDFIVW